MLIWNDRHITSELCAARGTGKPAVISIIRELGYRKVCATWVPKMRTAKQKTTRQKKKKKLCRISPAQCERLSRVTTGDETSVHHYDALTKRQQRSQVLLVHDNTLPHTDLRTRAASATTDWTVLPHSPNTPELAFSDPHLFGPLKDALRGRHFVHDDELKHSEFEH